MADHDEAGAKVPGDMAQREFAVLHDAGLLLAALPEPSRQRVLDTLRDYFGYGASGVTLGGDTKLVFPPGVREAARA